MEKNSICRHCIFMRAREVFKRARDVVSLIIYSCVLGRKEFGTEKGCRLYQRDEGQVKNGEITEEEARKFAISN